MAVPFPVPEFPPPCQSPCPHSLGSRKWDRRNASACVRVFIAVFCQPVVVGYVYIFIFSSVTHGFSVWLRNGGGGWMQRVAGVGGGDRWPRTAPRNPGTQPGSFPSQLKTFRGSPLPSAQSPDSFPGVGAAQAPSAFALPSEQGRVSWFCADR